MTLTTPVPRDQDFIFPGENLFLYWKTSASLWEGKLTQEASKGKLIIPVNWSFHSDNGESYDFGVKRPETDLKKIVDIARRLGREVAFFLPLGPVPFISNGGVPHLLARGISEDQFGQKKSVVDCEGNLNKIYSFFDPRVFKGYIHFIDQLNNYFKENNIKSPVYGFESGSIENRTFRSFLIDYSQTFENAFSRFLATKRSEDNTDTFYIDDAGKEFSLKQEFQASIKDLYQNSAVECFDGLYEGSLKVALLGASHSSHFDRMLGMESRIKISQEMFTAVELDVLPLSILIPSKVKQGVLSRQLSEVISGTVIPEKLSLNNYNESEGEFHGLHFFEIQDNSNIDGWKHTGLWEFITNKYPHAHKVLFEKDQTVLGNTDYRIINLFKGQLLDKDSFKTLLQKFMNGGKVILDNYLLEDSLKKRLESFILENNLATEDVNFYGPVRNISLGEGRLLIFDSNVIEQLSTDKKESFWCKIIETFELLHLQINMTEGVDLLWRTRSTLSSELNYEEVRRLGIYNSTSYKKKVKIPISNHFALMKVIDEINVKVKSSNSEVEIDLMPEGSVSLDFGIYA